jgi:hypothetical protein
MSSQPASERGTRPDRTRIAQVGLALIAVTLFLGNSPILGLLPATISFFLPKFRVLGWWLTVVLSLAFCAITVGGAIYLGRNWSTAVFEDSYRAYLSAGLMALMLLGCGLTFFGLLSKGTRNAVERRTLEIAPHAFDDTPPNSQDKPGSP